MTIRTFIIGFALLLSACASTRPPPTDMDLRLQAANHFFGGRYEYLVIHSSGQLGDAFFLQTSQVAGPSSMVRDLATRLAVAEKSSLRIMVSGVESTKTLDVIGDAFALVRGNRLPGLEFLFLGEPKDEATVRNLVESVGGVMHFAPFET